MNNKLDMWIMSNGKYFPAERLPIVQEKLAQLPESKINLLYALELKDPMMILIISIFLGVLGVDRFLLGDIGLGIAKLLTAGGCGVWAIIDIFFTHNKAKELNFMTVMQIVNQHSR